MERPGGGSRKKWGREEEIGAGRRRLKVKDRGEEQAGFKGMHLVI